MKTKKIPMRKCSGCMQMFPKKELVRVVRTPEKKDENGNVTENSRVVLDLTSKQSGRGAYVCRNVECLKKARKARRIERSLSVQIPDEVYNEMEKELSDE